MKRVLLINDLSFAGKSSLSVNMPIISTFGIETVPLPTMFLSAHTGFKNYSIFNFDEEFLKAGEDIKKLSLHFDLIYTGFFSNDRQINECERIIDELKADDTKIIVDPILGENGKLFSCFNNDYLYAMRKLIKKADIITPNITEAALLLDKSIEDNVEDLVNAFDSKVILKSVRKNNEIGYLVKDKNLTYIFKKEYKEKLHGTGDAFVSFFIGEYLNDNDLYTATLKASEHLENCIKDTIDALPEHWYGIRFEDYLKNAL